MPQPYWAGKVGAGGSSAFGVRVVGNWHVQEFEHGNCYAHIATSIFVRKRFIFSRHSRPDSEHTYQPIHEMPFTAIQRTH